MAHSYVLKGTWDELAVRAEELRTHGELTLIIPDQEESAQNGNLSGKSFDEAKWHAAIQIMEENADSLPILPPKAYSRKSVYMA